MRFGDFLESRGFKYNVTRKVISDEDLIRLIALGTIPCNEVKLFIDCTNLPLFMDFCQFLVAQKQVTAVDFQFINMNRQAKKCLKAVFKDSQTITSLTLRGDAKKYYLNDKNAVVRWNFPIKTLASVKSKITNLSVHLESFYHGIRLCDVLRYNPNIRHLALKSVPAGFMSIFMRLPPMPNIFTLELSLRRLDKGDHKLFYQNASTVLPNLFAITWTSFFTRYAPYWVFKYLASNPPSLRTCIFVGSGHNEFQYDHIQEALSANNHLKILAVRYFEFAQEPLDALAAGLAVNTTLKMLALTHSVKEDVTLDSIFKALHTNTTLQALTINNSYLNATDAVVPMLQTNTTLKRLILTDVRTHRPQFLLENILKSPSLNYARLGVHNNHITLTPRIVELATANTTLNHLYLFPCRYDNETVPGLAQWIRTNTTLTYLGLLGGHKMYDLIDAAADNDTLREFDVSMSHHASSKTAPAVVRCLEKNTTLTSLHLIKTIGSTASATMIIDALATNYSLTKLSLTTASQSPLRVIRDTYLNRNIRLRASLYNVCLGALIKKYDCDTLFDD